MPIIPEGMKCSYECRDMGFDCDWYCVEKDKDAVVKKVAAHAAEAHNIPNAQKDKILSKIKEPANPNLECDITAKEEGREEDPGCAISG
jgi:predicted small metal-binding protein